MLDDYKGPMLVQDKAIMEYILSIDPSLNNGVINPILNYEEPKVELNLDLNQDEYHTNSAKSQPPSRDGKSTKRNLSNERQRISHAI